MLIICKKYIAVRFTLLMCLGFGGSFATSASAEIETCRAFNSLIYQSISSKRTLELMLENDIGEQYRSYRDIDWTCLVEKFENIGEDASVKILPLGSYDEITVFRFTIENIEFTPKWVVTGGSNGVFTAIFTVYPDGLVTVIENGGRPRVLRLR